MDTSHERGRSGWLFSVFVLVSISCARSDLGPVDDQSSCWPSCEQVEPEVAWGTFTEGLPIGPCPASSHPTLVVDTTAHELVPDDPSMADRSQAGDTLSFHEALVIAGNRAGMDTIEFSPSAFPVEQPETILLYDSLPLASVSDVCIDGRGRGVQIDWTPGSTASAWHPNNAVVFGLVLLRPPIALSGLTQIAGCRVGTDGHAGLLDYNDGYDPWSIRAGVGTIVGPGNVIYGPFSAIRSSGGAEITGNWLGYDPASRRLLHLATAITFSGSAPDTLISGNVFAVSTAFDSAAGDASGATINGNSFGVDPDGNTLPAPADGSYHGGIGVIKGDQIVVGPANTVRNTDAAVTVAAGSTNVTITRNSFSGNQQGIVFLGTNPVSPPVIESVGAGAVVVRCGVDGTVELYSDTGDQAERFLTSASCLADQATSIVVDLSDETGRNLTALLHGELEGMTSELSAPFSL